MKVISFDQYLDGGTMKVRVNNIGSFRDGGTVKLECNDLSPGKYGEEVTLYVDHQIGIGDGAVWVGFPRREGSVRIGNQEQIKIELIRAIKDFEDSSVRNSEMAQNRIN